MPWSRVVPLSARLGHLPPPTQGAKPRSCQVLRGERVIELADETSVAQPSRLQSARETGTNVNDRPRRPLAATRRREPTVVESLRGGVGALAHEPGQNLVKLLRPRVGLPAQRLGCLLPRFSRERLRSVRIAELHTASLGGGKRRLRAFRDLGALLLGNGRIDVEHERVGVRMLGHDERDGLRHQARDKGYITGEAIQLRHNNGASVERRPLQRRL